MRGLIYIGILAFCLIFWTIVLYVLFQNIEIMKNLLSANLDITEIKKHYSNLIVLYYDEVNTIQFGSTCKHVILSHGSFSATIGYLAFFSQIFFPEYESNKEWYGDMFSIPEFREISFVNKRI